ncbi:hypothetical protein ACFVT5_40510 [Streptomyces sp. NPDC058001]|uniref:hypothetical protein n=1 Tax=Streptomyces sp. NPDC058001 TaxID=3346300 RepID=UPI0036E92587
MSGGEVSGVDLARVALRTVREAARRNGGSQKAKMTRIVTTVRRDGREQMALGAVSGSMVTERACVFPTVGATLREWWAAFAPELAGARGSRDRRSLSCPRPAPSGR